MSDTTPSTPPAGEQRRLAAIVFTDVVGYSARMQRDETGTMKLVAADFALMRERCAQHGGELLNSMGDGLLLCFGSAVQAVACALQIQAEFAARRAKLPPEEALEHRMGVHIGDVFRQETGGVAGDGVNIAARLEGKAPVGGVCVSQMVYDTVKGKLPMQAVFVGPEIFKNITEPIPIWHLAAEGAPALSRPPLTAAKSKQRTLPLAAGAMAVVLVAAVVLWAPWGKSSPAAGAAQPVEAAKAPTTKAGQLIAQARALYGPWSLATGDDLFLAERLLKEATELEQNNAEAWAALAVLSYGLRSLGFDVNDARDEIMRTSATRAIKLNPQSAEARLAQALTYRVEQGTRGEALAVFRELLGRHSADKFILRETGVLLLTMGQKDEGWTMLKRAAALPGGDPVALLCLAEYLRYDTRFDEAEKALEQALALRPDFGLALVEQIFLASLRGDLPGMKEMLLRLPARLLADERVAAMAAENWLLLHDTAKALETLNFIKRDYIEFSYFDRPKALWVGLAHQMAGRPDAAKTQWQAGLRVIEKRLAGNSTNIRTLTNKARLLALLGEKEPASETLRLIEQLSGEPVGKPNSTTMWIYADLGRDRELADFFDSYFDQAPRELSIWLARFFLYHPEFDAVRAKPLFASALAKAQRLIASAAKKPAAKK